MKKRSILIGLVILLLVAAAMVLIWREWNTITKGGDPTIIGALIGGGGVILAALIGGGFVVYQVRQNARLEREKLELDKERIRLQQEAEEARQAREREQHRKETEAEAAKRAMQQEQTQAERVQVYRAALRADPRIARLQILGMTQPLEITNIYVRVRVHQETRPGFDPDPALAAAEKQGDPNILLQAGLRRLEQLAGAALDPADAIRRHGRCVIVGDPGAGKTTLLKHLALQAVDGRLDGLPDLPIHLELNAFATTQKQDLSTSAAQKQDLSTSAAQDQDLLTFAAKRWDKRYGFPQADAHAYMDQQLKEGKAILLLEALDETTIGTSAEEAEASYSRAWKAIDQLAARYHQAPIVVTARKAGYHQRPRLSGFTELEVLDFQPEDIRQFVSNWFQAHPDPTKRAYADDLIARLERNARISSLAANPLLLSLIVIVYEAGLDLPERRAELYKQCVETLLKKWDASRSIRRLRAFTPEHKQQLLTEVAWHFHQQGRRYLPDQELLDVIADFLPTIGLAADQKQQILDEIAVENGLLKQQAEGWHGFLHLTLQEYFAALSIHTDQQLEYLLAQRGSPWWEEVFLLYAGLAPDASALLQRLLGLDAQHPLQEDMFHTNLILAGRCLAARPTVRQADLREEVIARLFDLLLTTRYVLTQRQAAEALAEIGGEQVNQRLLGLLADARLDPAVRERIAAALGRLGERSVAPALVPLLSDARLDPAVCARIAAALGRLGERSVAPALVPLLSDARLDPAVRGRIADALGTLGERSVAPALVPLLSDARLDPDVRGDIADALGTLGERSVAPALVPLLSDARLDSAVRERIADALGTLGERSVAPALVPLLSDARLDPAVRGRIAAALGTLGERSVAPALLALLSDARLDPAVRERIAAALGTLGERSVAPALLALLSDARLDYAVRGSIALALGTLGERSVVPALVPLLSDARLDSVVRGRIAAALGALTQDEATVRKLAQLLRKPGTDNIANGIYEALWEISRKARLRIFINTRQRGKPIEIARW